MKLISQFKNKYNKITYTTYETENRIKVVYLNNPSTIDFDISVIFLAGSSFEISENVPRGTAHFLEHMLLNPNDIFKNKAQTDKFEQGTRERPSIYSNAYTSKKYIYLTCHSNQKGYARAIERVQSMLTFSKKKVTDQLEKERGIILAEQSRELKKEKDSYLESLDFVFKGIADEFTDSVLGENDDIKSITVEDLHRYFTNRFVSNNSIISVQSNGPLQIDVSKKIEKLSKNITEGNKVCLRKIDLKNKFRVGVFEDDRANGIAVSFFRFENLVKKFDYKRECVMHITEKLLDWLTFDILREKMSLIYDFRIYNTSSLSFDYEIRGYRFVTEKEKIEKTLEELYKVFYTISFNFLKSKKGKEWFADVVSSYIFPRTVKFNEDIAESASIFILEDGEIYNNNIAVREAKKVKIDDITEYLNIILEIPPHVWVESDMSKKDMIDIINRSPFYKKFSKKKK